MAFIPNPRDLPYVNHKDGNKVNNAASNLEWMSAGENTQHAQYTLRQMGKLSPEDVEHIKRRYNAGDRQEDLAARYRISQNAISQIVQRKTWRACPGVVKQASIGAVPDPVLEWRASPSFPGYSVSSFGQIRRDRCGMFTRAGTPVPIQLSAGSHGYPRVNLSTVLGGSASIAVHRLVAEAFLGPAEGRFVNHRNGDRTDNRITNLEYVTAAGNMRHRFGYAYRSA